jgi:DNA-binding transcriptional LysR family regulator
MFIPMRTTFLRNHTNDFTQFNYFEIIAQKGSFSNAAAYLFVSQPAVSMQISLMEEELGFRLLSVESAAPS